MSMQDTIKKAGIKQKFIAEKFDTSETIISMFVKNEELFRKLEAYVRGLE